MEGIRSIGLRKLVFYYKKVNARVSGIFPYFLYFFVPTYWKDVKQVLRHYPTHIDAVLQLYPNIGLSFVKFDVLPSEYFPLLSFLFLFVNKFLLDNYWHSEDNRRNFFREIANTMKFDPLVATNWYKIKKEDILPFKVLRRLFIKKSKPNVI